LQVLATSDGKNIFHLGCVESIVVQQRSEVTGLNGSKHTAAVISLKMLQILLQGLPNSLHRAKRLFPQTELLKVSKKKVGIF
jgi:hypothetical protein